MRTRGLALAVVTACGSGGKPADHGDAPGTQVDAAPICTAAAAVPLADFESGAIPSSESGATEGFRDSDVARGTVVPGANGTANAAEFSFATDTSWFFQGNVRPQYLNGSATYDATLANALAYWIQIPSGSGLLSSTDQTFSIYTYHWKPGDPWVGPNSGADLTDSQMHGYGPIRFDPSGADRWLRVVMSAAAFDHSRGNYHFYATRAIVEDLQMIPAMRQFQAVVQGDIATGPVTARFDELQLLSLCPTASVTPDSSVQTVSASGGDVAVPIALSNPSDHDRTYRAFVSSTIGVARQTLESAMHDTDDVATIDDLQGGIASDGGLGAAELFAADAGGEPTGPSIARTGTAIAVPAHGSWNGVIVHHVTAGMLGTTTQVMSDGMTFAVQRDTLVTSAVFWDPDEPRLSDPAVVFYGSNADSSHPAPPGFPPFQAPPAGWASTDIPPDQAGAYFVSVLTLTP
ncbi:MAG TPA: hypothetical protein VMJ10_29145 [Kofleriaceae bacterium]|nr:hypothetical protein [Kofleriaceae bacterium]